MEFSEKFRNKIGTWKIRTEIPKGMRYEIELAFSNPILFDSFWIPLQMQIERQISWNMVDDLHDHFQKRNFREYKEN